MKDDTLYSDPPDGAEATTEFRLASLETRWVAIDKKLQELDANLNWIVTSRVERVARDKVEALLSDIPDRLVTAETDARQGDVRSSSNRETIELHEESLANLEKRIDAFDQAIGTLTRLTARVEALEEVVGLRKEFVPARERMDRKVNPGDYPSIVESQPYGHADTPEDLAKVDPKLAAKAAVRKWHGKKERERMIALQKQIVDFLEAKEEGDRLFLRANASRDAVELLWAKRPSEAIGQYKTAAIMVEDLVRLAAAANIP